MPSASNNATSSAFHRRHDRPVARHPSRGPREIADAVRHAGRLARRCTDNVLAPLQAASTSYRIAAGPRARRKVLTLVGGIVGCGDLREPHRSRDALCANAHGFSLHAGVRCDAEDRQGIEQLCRYITRPAIANERLSVNRDGNVVLKLKTPWRNGTTHIVLTPMEFMQRLAALVPRPQLHLIRFHGVLAEITSRAGAASTNNGGRGGLQPRAQRTGAHDVGAAAQARVRY